MKEFLAKHQGPGRVLIPGCGSGYEIEAFSSAGWDVIGIDFSKVAVARARRLLGSVGRQGPPVRFSTMRYVKGGST